MLNALSTALFAIALRLASEVTAPPDGLLALAANPRVRSASDLLTDIRMTVAANALKTSNMSTGASPSLPDTNPTPPSSARLNIKWASHPPSGAGCTRAPG